MRILEALVILSSLLFSQDLQILRMLVCARPHHGSAVLWELRKGVFYPFHAHSIMPLSFEHMHVCPMHAAPLWEGSSPFPCLHSGVKAILVEPPTVSVREWSSLPLL